MSMKTFKVLAALLSYPERELLAALDELEDVLEQELSLNGAANLALAPLLDRLASTHLLQLQQEYVATFDQNPSHALHLFEHIHGESRRRGPAMVDLLQEYRAHGLEIDAAELPDYLPLFLEYLSLLPDAQALALLGEAVDVLALLGAKLERNRSPYHVVFKVLESLSPVQARELTQAPVRDMDEAMAEYGPTPEGVEPLLVPKPQPIMVKPPRRATAATHAYRGFNRETPR